MNKVILIAAFFACLAFANSQKTGSFSETEYNEEYHKEALTLAIKELTESFLSESNSIPHFVNMYQKIVSGIIYKFVF